MQARVKRVMVLGDGVVGTTTAWYLAQAGYEVVVVDRQPLPANETSYGNAGQLSFGYTSPWAAPGIPLKAIKWLFQQHSPLRIQPTLDPLQLRWLWAMWRNCDAGRYAVNKARMVRMSQYSGRCFAELRAETGIQYEGRQLGTLQLFRTQQQLDAAQQDVSVLAEAGVPYELLDAAGIARLEPALASAPAQLLGALRTPGDETGDCRLFTRNLAELATRQGVEFRHGQTIDRLETDGGRITGVVIDGKREQADAYVVALGSYAPQLLAPLGMYLPVYPLKGYSLTVPITNSGMAPVSTILDESYKVAITRFDQRMRVGGMAEVAGFDLSLRRNRRETLELVVNDLYPQAGDLPAAEFWTGLRPATPDGTPVVGKTRFDNLFLNAGHGTLGWTMSCGSARYLTDIIAGRTPEIDTEGFAISRYEGQA